MVVEKYQINILKKVYSYLKDIVVKLLQQIMNIFKFFNRKIFSK